MQRQNPGRPPSWDEERLLRLDRAALKLGKRCVMWDDSGGGFYLMLNWDWEKNLPAHPSPEEDPFAPGWIHHAREILRPPLLDPSVPDERLSDWLDAHTMRVHAELHQRRGKIRRVEDGTRSFRLNDDDEYWLQLRSLEERSD